MQHKLLLSIIFCLNKSTRSVQLNPLKILKKEIKSVSLNCWRVWNILDQDVTHLLHWSPAAPLPVLFLALWLAVVPVFPQTALILHPALRTPASPQEPQSLGFELALHCSNQHLDPHRTLVVSAAWSLALVVPDHLRQSRSIQNRQCCSRWGHLPRCSPPFPRFDSCCFHLRTESYLHLRCLAGLQQILDKDRVLISSILA